MKELISIFTFAGWYRQVCEADEVLCRVRKPGYADLKEVRAEQASDLETAAARALLPLLRD